MRSRRTPVRKVMKSKVMKHSKKQPEWRVELRPNSETDFMFAIQLAVLLIVGALIIYVCT